MQKKQEKDMSLVDTMFGCDETPVWFPAVMDINEIPQCSSCVLRLTAPIPGPGTITAPNSINENPLTTLSVNGIQHNLIDTVLYFPGVHRFPNSASVHDGEILFYFHNVNKPSVRIVLCIPIVVGTGASNAYFSTLSHTVTAKRPAMTTLLDANATFISYKGADVRGRSADDSRPRKLCQPVAYPITYYVSMRPTHILAADKTRLEGLLRASGAPKPMTEVARARMLQLATQIKGIKLEDDTRRIRGGRGGAPSTAAMKCYRLDTTKDIVGNKVYIGGKKPTTTLEEELAATKSAVDKPIDYSVDASVSASVQPGDIERVLGIVIGVVLGVIVCATVAYYVWKNTFRNYLNVQKLYDSPISASKLSAKFPELPSLCPQPSS